MKKLFLLSFLLLVLASAATYWSLPEQQSDRPIIYWAVQPDAGKMKMRDLFYRWREARGLPPVELRLDAANRDKTKKMVQGVSGVGSDLIDVWTGEMMPLQSAGVLADITEAAESYGVTPAATYPGAASELVVAGRQYAFPRNVVATMIWVNRDVFDQYGITPPPRRWTIEEFDRLGREFVEAANPPGRRDRVYFINQVPRLTLRRSLGVDMFNETLTRCVLDDPRNVEMMRYLRKWVIDDKLVPTREAEQAFAADASGFRLRVSLFARGQYAMLSLGRWALILLRELPPVNLAVVEPFHGGFPNVDLAVGGVGVYAGSPHPEIASSFLGFLASEAFNMTVVESGDSLPPLPRYAQTEAFRQPPDRPNEWGTHEVFAESALAMGIGPPRSPFVLPSVFSRLESDAYDSMVAGRISPEEAARQAADRINREIQISLEADPALRPVYEQGLALQRKIEQARAAGRLVPAAWILNPFYRDYYRAQGWLTDAAEPVEAAL
ncbi:MAG: extracellular solute-binding protein [Opitutaceae bacterium]|nr:extracellular solute-binding protein [Cephaloticoccus sp.]MCP5529250.1 extracellular solute-binding protein [Opitutaceae bacterium]